MRYGMCTHTTTQSDMPLACSISKQPNNTNNCFSKCEFDLWFMCHRSTYAVSIVLKWTNRCHHCLSFAAFGHKQIRLALLSENDRKTKSKPNWIHFDRNRIHGWPYKRLCHHTSFTICNTATHAKIGWHIYFDICMLVPIAILIWNCILWGIIIEIIKFGACSVHVSHTHRHTIARLRTTNAYQRMWNKIDVIGDNSSVSTRRRLWYF